MSILLSELLEQCGLSDCAQVIDEKPFDVFARATTVVDGQKCIFLANKKYAKSIDSSVSMVITSESTADEIERQGYGICVTDDPRGLFFELMSFYEKGIGFEKFDTVIGKNCEISKTAVIAPYNVIIGDNAKIGDFVVIHPNTTVGDNVTIQTGTRLGEQDFNVYTYKGVTKQVYHGGKVVIGSNVLISSGVLVGQALYSYGVTYIGDNCFIGADTCIGHNTTIQNDCEICGNSMLGGYCNVGEHAKLFMAVTIANATTIGKNVTVNMGSVVIRDVPDSKTVFGNPAREIVAPK